CGCGDGERRGRETRERGPPAARAPLAEPGATSSSEFHGYVQYQNPWPESRSAPRGGEESPQETGTNDSVGAQVEELERGETAIDPVSAREELFVAARFRHPSLLDHPHPIRVAHRAQPAGDDEERARPHEIG